MSCKGSFICNVKLKMHTTDFDIPMGARCSSMVTAFAHGAIGCRIEPSWGGPIELFLIPASAPRLVYQRL